MPNPSISEHTNSRNPPAGSPMLAHCAAVRTDFGVGWEGKHNSRPTTIKPQRAHDHAGLSLSLSLSCRHATRCGPRCAKLVQVLKIVQRVFPPFSHHDGREAIRIYGTHQGVADYAQVPDYKGGDPIAIAYKGPTSVNSLVMAL